MTPEQILETNRLRVARGFGLAFLAAAIILGVHFLFPTHPYKLIDHVHAFGNALIAWFGWAIDWKNRIHSIIEGVTKTETTTQTKTTIIEPTKT